MVRIAALIFSFWASGCFAAALFTCAVFLAPGSRTSPLLPVALLVLSILFWHAGMGLWRPRQSSASRVRVAAAASGPLFGLAAWSTSAPEQLSNALIAVVLGWVLFTAAAWWLSRRISLQLEMVAPAS